MIQVYNEREELLAYNMLTDDAYLSISFSRTNLLIEIKSQSRGDMPITFDELGFIIGVKARDESIQFGKFITRIDLLRDMRTHPDVYQVVTRFKPRWSICLDKKTGINCVE